MPLPHSKITRHAAVLLFAALSLQAALAQTVAELRKRCHDGAVAQTAEFDAGKRKDQADAVAQYQIDMRNCGPDRNCKSAATQRYQARQREIANQATLNAATVRKNEIECNRVHLQAQTPQYDPRGGPWTGTATTNTTGTAYNPGVGTPLPAMSGSATYGDVTLSVATPAGRRIGQVQQGAVSIVQGPRRYSWAEGQYVSPTRYQINRLWDLQRNEVPLPGPIEVPMTRR